MHPKAPKTFIEEEEIPDNMLSDSSSTSSEDSSSSCNTRRRSSGPFHIQKVTNFIRPKGRQSIGTTRLFTKKPREEDELVLRMRKGKRPAPFVCSIVPSSVGDNQSDQARNNGGLICYHNGQKQVVTNASNSRKWISDKSIKTTTWASICDFITIFCALVYALLMCILLLVRGVHSWIMENSEGTEKSATYSLEEKTSSRMPDMDAISIRSSFQDMSV